MARSFNGSSDYLAASVNLSGFSALSVAFWLRVTNYVDNGLALEFGDIFNGGSFHVNTSETVGGSPSNVTVGGSAPNFNQARFDRPGTGVWHHWCVLLDRDEATNEVVAVYIDGVSQSLTHSATGNHTDAFASATLWFMSRAGTSLFVPGHQAEVAIWGDALLTADEAASLTRGRLPFRVCPGTLAHYWPLWGVHSTELDLVGGANATVNGTTRVDHAPVELFSSRYWHSSFEGAAAGGGVNLAAINDYYRRLRAA